MKLKDPDLRYNAKQNERTQIFYAALKSAFNNKDDDDAVALYIDYMQNIPLLFISASCGCISFACMI